MKGNQIYLASLLLLFLLDVDSLVWVERPLLGDIPEGRDGHSAFAIGNKMFVFGGRSEQQLLNDLSVVEIG